MYVLRDLSDLHQSGHRKRKLTCHSAYIARGEVLMRRSTERILTTHVGSLIRPPEIANAIRAGGVADMDKRLRAAVCDVVKRQADVGIDIPSDGEYSKPNFASYVNQRLTGFELRTVAPISGVAPSRGRDRKAFAEFYAEYDRAEAAQERQSAPHVTAVCTGPIEYVGDAQVQRDIANLNEAIHAAAVQEAFIPAVAPGTIEGQRPNEHYPSTEAYLFAIADAMRHEYRAIVDAGFLLQVDDPRTAVMYDLHDPAPGREEYRAYVEVRLAALARALAGIPPDRVRYHVCWGSWHGPHSTDIPLADILDLILEVPVGAYALEGANPRHEHEYHVWERVKLPAGKILIPGVIAHTTNTVEHPELVAERIDRYAERVGAENVIAGSDCGFAQGALYQRVHPSIMWAKLQALVEGARLASRRLY
jgi:5-methyltetrahydropteroyltriglutamate--homocysteine methyltransferase